MGKTVMTKMKFNKICYFFCFLLSFSCSVVHGANSGAGEYLDSLLRGHAFRAIVHRRPRTGALYNATLPQSLAGMRVAVVRLRSRTLWRNGTIVSNFRIPPETLPAPSVKRLLVVYQDLGNWSSLYYNLTGYRLITSVVGFSVYDSSNLSSKNTRKLDLIPMKKPISIQFSNYEFPIGNAKCAKFGSDGKFELSDTSSGSPVLCYSRGQGHFAVVAPVGRRRRRKKTAADLGVIGFVIGFFGLIVVGSIGISILRMMRAKKIDRMERRADDGVVLGTVWIGGSKMPSATVTRTHPILENGDLP